MCMHYMMDIESHTVIYLRDLLATRAAADPQITAFLSCWVYEELWHGEAFSDFLRAYGIEEPFEPRLPDGSRPAAHSPQPPARAARSSSASATASRSSRRWLGSTLTPRLRRDPHDLGRDQRADHADRLLRS